MSGLKQEPAKPLLREETRKAKIATTDKLKADNQGTVMGLQDNRLRRTGYRTDTGPRPAVGYLVYKATDRQGDTKVYFSEKGCHDAGEEKGQSKECGNRGNPVGPDGGSDEKTITAWMVEGEGRGWDRWSFNVNIYLGVYPCVIPIEATGWKR